MNQKNPRRSALTALAAAGLALTLAPGAFGAEMARASFYGGGVDLQPSVSYSQAVLTVSGGDTVERRVFGAGEIPTIGVVNAEGQVLADGVYTWELELVPDQATARALRQAATLNGGVAPESWQRQNGSFAVVGGAMIGPGLIEAGQTPQPRVRTAHVAAAAAGPGRDSQIDDDAAVGLGEGVEESVRAAARTAAGAPQLPDPRGAHRSDAAGATEPAPAARAVSRATTTRPLSDGTNGRDKDQ